MEYTEFHIDGLGLAGWNSIPGGEIFYTVTIIPLTQQLPNVVADHSCHKDIQS